MVDIKRISRMACIDVSGDEEKSKKHIESITRAIEFINALNAIDTTGVEPFSYHVEQNMRHDNAIVDGGDKQKKVILSNAPATDGDHFLVPKVIK